MPRYITTQKEQNNFMFPVDLKAQIIPGSFAHTLELMIDTKINLQLFEAKFNNDLSGRPAYPPRVLLKIVLYSYANGIFSSRRIAQFVTTNIVATALAEATTPDFTSIAAFISEMKDSVESVFVQVLLVAQELNLLGNTRFALDGCKLSSNASKEKSGTFSDLRKKQKKLKEKVAHLIKLNVEKDINQEEQEQEKMARTIKKVEKAAQQIETFLDQNTEKLGTRNQAIHSNISDNESATLKTSHGVIQGYNSQAMVDEKHQIIVGAEVFGQTGDNNLLAEMINLSADNLKKAGAIKEDLAGAQVLADTGYFSHENIKAGLDAKVDAYIPDQFFRKRDPRFVDKARFVLKKQDRFGREDFVYQENKNVVLCPAGQELIASRPGTERIVNFIKYKRYHGNRKTCTACLLRSKCLGEAKTPYRVYQIRIEERGENNLLTMMDKMDSVEGRHIYSKRMGIVEPVFANIRVHKRLDHFTLRGKEKVHIQWMLYALVHNISKISIFGNLVET